MADVWVPRLFGGLFGTVGLAMILFFPSKGTLHCTPDPAVCVIDRGSLAVPETVSIKRDAIRLVEVQESEGDEGPTWRPVFILKDGRTEPWVDSFSNTGEHERWADQVATWLEKPDNELTISADLGWLTWIIGLVFLLIGSITFVSAGRGD